MKPVSSNSYINVKFQTVGWGSTIYNKIYDVKPYPCAFVFRSVKPDEITTAVQNTGFCKECNGVLLGKCYKEPSQSQGATFVLTCSSNLSLPHFNKRKYRDTDRELMKAESLKMRPQQIRLGNDIRKYTQNPFELDVTAGVVLQIPRKSGQRRDIYLTNLISRVGGESVTLASVLSEKNDANFLSYFLNEYQRHGGKPPERMVIDMGKALQAAINMSCNKCSFKTYNSRCLKTIVEGGDIFEYDIRTQLMTDVAHFLHAASNWPCFTKAEFKVKELFMRCLGFMTDIDSLDVFAEFLEKVFILSDSKTYDSYTQSALQYLMKTLKKYKLDKTYENIANNSEVSAYDDNEGEEGRDHEQETDTQEDYEIGSLDEEVVDDDYEDNDNADDHDYDHDHEDRDNAVDNCNLGHGNPTASKRKEPKTPKKLGYVEAYSSEIRKKVILDPVERKKISERVREKNEKKGDGDREDVSDEEGFLTENNDYYLKSFGESLARVCSKFLCWTNVRNGIFGNTQIKKKTSARVESGMGIVKSSVLPNGKPIRLDAFFVRHCRHLEAGVLIGKSNMSNFIKSGAVLKKNTKLEYKEVIQGRIPYDNCYRLTDRWKKKVNEDDIARDEFDDQVGSHSGPNGQESAPRHVDSFDDHSYASSMPKNHVRESDSYAVFENEILLSSSSNGQELNVCVPQMIDALQCNTPSTTENISNNVIGVDKFSDMKQDSFVEELRNVDYDDKTLNKIKEKVLANYEDPNQRRGHYLTRPENLDVQLHSTKKKLIKGKPGENIQNGGEGRSGLLMNTCPVDSVTEILSNSCSIKNFHGFLMKSKNEALSGKNLCYASTVLSHSVLGSTSRFYQSQFNICQTLFRKNGSFVIDCNLNVSLVFRELMKEYNATVSYVDCPDCNRVISKEILTVALPRLDIALIDHYTTLESDLNEFFNEAMCMCMKCGSPRATRQYLLGPYLVIETEDAYQHTHYASKETSMVVNLRHYYPKFR
ncbi:hypothetical protein QAD02_021901 [Eretmocerus hayati]|uniref:Uncharacterized protein n=1 Tax=Eretmocerus hayati TaxID=131215 RepID=A0ACC2PRT6_9HYME|nr:hypothetical protein QAD02_021901 [Eretmocerus hayati]